jgi:endoglucanase
MPDPKAHLKSLISLPGLSAFEEPVREVIAEAWRPLVDELTTSRTGTLYGLKRGSGPEPRPRILLASHMDAIGLMVTSITQGGFLRFTEVGGVDPRILPYSPVMVHGTAGSEPRALPAIVVQPPDTLLPPSQRGRPAQLQHLLIDTGLEEQEVRAAVRVGDVVAFDTQPIELAGDTLAGHTLDDRAAVAAVTACLEELQHSHHAWDVYATATVQEEETLLGAFTSSYELRPQIAVALDVTFAKGPGANDYRTSPLGKGVSLDWGPNTHPVVLETIKEKADPNEQPHNNTPNPSR